MAEAAGATLMRVQKRDGAPVRVAHLTTVDMSLWLLLATELAVDVDSGLETFGLSAPGPYVERVESLGVRHVPLPSLTRSWDPRQDLRAARELATALDRIRPDVLHTHNPKTGVLGRVLGRLRHVPVVVNTCHGLWAGAEDSWKRRLPVLGAEVVAAAFSHGELYQNATDRDTLARWVRTPTEVVGNGVDLDRFDIDPDARARVRAQIGVADDEVLVGGVGRMVREKGIEEFVSAADAVRERATTPVRFVWAGPADPDKPDAMAGSGLGAVEPLGLWEDMPGLYNALDVFVLPSYREGLSRSGMEAACCGTAMVLSDIRGCREIGTHDRELLLVPPRDAAALTDAITSLVEDSARRRSLAGAGRHHARLEFDQRRVAARSIATYASVARRRGLGWTAEGAP